MKLFDAFKYYIVKHPNVAAYKPSSEKYNNEKYMDILNELEPQVTDFSEEECAKVEDFIEISNYLHRLYIDFYKDVQERLADFNMKGEEIVEFFIAFLNKEHKTLHKKISDVLKKTPQGTYLYQDISNHKFELQDGTKLDLKATMEAETDAISLLCNYMRYHLDEDYKNEHADSKGFTTNLLQLFQMANILATFKNSYDNTLFDKMYVKIDIKRQKIVFDFDNNHNEKLITLGHAIIGERIMHVACQNMKRCDKLILEHYVTNYRIEHVAVNNGFVTLEFGEGNPELHLDLVKETHAAIDSYYEFLNLNLKLEKLGGIRVAETIGVWVALRYVCYESMMHMDCSRDGALYTKEDMSHIPRKFRKEDLTAYIVKLTDIRQNLVETVLEALETDWKKYNDIWTAPLFKIKDYYCLPFYPIVNSVPYNMIEHLMSRGGYDLEKRGYDFEQYVYKQISKTEHQYQVNCVAAKKFGTKVNGEEIDLLVSLRDVVVLAEAKCIHYLMDPQNYCDAWGRIATGTEQALRKVAFLKEHPELFAELGDVKNKKIIPVVLTNYPIYSGLEQNGVYIIDSHTFIYYFNSGHISKRVISPDSNLIVNTRPFYHNETEFSANFEACLRNNPVKSIYMSKMSIEDIPLLLNIEPWECIAKTAVYLGNPSFDISNRPKSE